MIKITVEAENQIITLGWPDSVDHLRYLLAMFRRILLALGYRYDTINEYIPEDEDISL